MQKFETKKIDDATPEELRAYAVAFLGIPLEAETSDGEVLAKVRAANEGDLIYVSTGEVEIDQTGAPPPDVEQSSGLVGGFGRDDPRVELTLHAEERDGVVVTRHKEVGVNGVVWLLKRGEPITVPYRVYLALENAERDNISHDKEGTVIIQKVKNTPYNVHRMPSAAEIADWHKRTDDLLLPG